MNKQETKKTKFSLASMLGRSKMRYGTYTAILIAVVVVVVILANIAVGALEDRFAMAFDLTATKVTDFSDATYQTLKELDQDVHIYTMYNSSTSSTSRIQLEEILNKYAALNRHVKWENIDPTINPTQVTKLAGGNNVSEGSIAVTNGDETRVKFLNSNELYSTYSNPFTNATQRVFVAENRLTSAVLFVSAESTPRVFFLTGHGELDADSTCTVLKATLVSENFDVAKLDLDKKDVELKAGDTVVIIDPQRDLSDEQYETMRNWMDEGGRLLFSLSYNVDFSVQKNFKRLLDYYGLAFDEGNIVEDSSASSNWYSATYMLKPNMDAEHDITKDLVSKGHYLLLPYMRPVAAVEMPQSGYTYTPILTTSPKAIVQNGEEISMPGTKNVAMTALRSYFDDAAQKYVPEKDIRIALIGGYFSFADTNLLQLSYNMDFSLSLFNWLANRTVSVSVYSKTIADTTLRIPDATTAWTLAAIVVIVLPLICLIGGIVVWIKRRRL